MRYLLTIIALLIAIKVSLAQTFSLKGTITDSSRNMVLQNVSVTLLEAKDSTLTDNTNTNKEGLFLFQNVDTGKYVLLISYMGYEDKSLFIHIKDSILNIGKITLNRAAEMLQEVVVQTERGAIRIRGDTTEFNTRYFPTQKNANVEALLKKLPGVEVNRKGEITAQGEQVKKVLVDGDEFFGDDPTLVTKNLRADMVKKVQLFNRKSDQAIFTGIDDGVREKTINLELKEDKKHGVFGTAEAGIGNKKYYEGKASVNSFKTKRKVSAFLQGGNTSNSALSYGQSANLGFGNPQSYSGSFQGQGIPAIITGGIHYDNKWLNDKHYVNGNYVYNKVNVRGDNHTLVQNNQPDRILYTRMENQFRNNTIAHNGDAEYKWKIDSSNQLIIRSGYNYQLVDNQTKSAIQNSANADEKLNDGTTTNASKGNSGQWNLNINWGHNFKKKGRSIFLNAKRNQSSDNTTNHLFARNNFYKNNQTDSSSVIDQQKTNKNTNETTGLNVVYTEPLSSEISLIANYGIDWQYNEQNLRSYNNVAGNQYTELDSLYSTHFRLNQNTQTSGLRLNYSVKKMLVSFGTDVSLASLIQENLLQKKEQNRNFINWNPKVSFRYNFSAFHYLIFHYQGNTAQPTFNQLQPLHNNNDPFNIYVGNEYLRPSFSNQLKLNYMKFTLLSGMFMGVDMAYSNTINAITTNVSTDPLGISTYSYFNIPCGKNYNYSTRVNYGKKFTRPDLTVAGIAGYQGVQFVNFVNDQQNITESASTNLGAHISYALKDRLELFLQPSATYYQNKYSINRTERNNYWGMNTQFSADVYFLKKAQFSTEIDYIYTRKTNNFPQDFSRFIWNVWLGYKFLKSETLLLKISCFDILNQNKGFSRTAQNNLLTENYYSTMQRYFMASLIWQFKKFGAFKN